MIAKLASDLTKKEIDRLRDEGKTVIALTVQRHADDTREHLPIVSVSLIPVEGRVTGKTASKEELEEYSIGDIIPGEKISYIIDAESVIGGFFKRWMGKTEVKKHKIRVVAVPAQGFDQYYDTFVTTRGPKKGQPETVAVLMPPKKASQVDPAP